MKLQSNEHRLNKKLFITSALSILAVGPVQGLPRAALCPPLVYETHAGLRMTGNATGFHLRELREA